LKVTEPGAEEE